MVGEETGRRRAVSAEYEQVMREIGEVFAQRKEAEALGVLDAVDLRLAELRGKKDELQARLNACHEEGDAWVEKALQCFRLIELLQEAIFYGSREPREQVLRAVVSNFTLDGRKLVPKLKTPFRERSRKGGHPEWWATLYDVRTEIAQTADLLQKAFEAVAQAQLLAAAQV
jgi:hypothetical protein